MASKYRYIDAVGQYDENACWAASLEWWLKATNLGNIYQDDVFEYYPSFRDTNGTITREGIQTLITDPQWYMSYDHVVSATTFSKSKVKQHLKSGPMYIGYWDQKVGGYHVNVIYAYGAGQVSVMEPMGEKEQNGPGYIGKHLKRKLSYYKFGGEIFIGSPAA
ncbi:MAG TPA: hypothetical protein VJL58_08250, partial [Pyrinomonadaceae bacterium]|nr:hypothetical protein [Pyrinomonadaceae bacterium]